MDESKSHLKLDINHKSDNYSTPRPNEISTHRCSINKNQKPIRKNINSKEHASNHPILQKHNYHHHH